MSLRRGAGAVALLVALLAACSKPPDPLAACRLPADGTVLAIGDSITRGHGADGQGYPEQLQSLLAAEPGRERVQVINLGRDGERSAGLRERLDAALAEHRPSVVLITSGGNDFLRRVPAPDTRANLQAIVERVRAAGAVPVLFAVPAPTLAAAVGALSDHELYEALADDARVVVIDDVVSDVLGRPELTADRIHPNVAGYARMAQAAREVLARCH